MASNDGVEVKIMSRKHISSMIILLVALASCTQNVTEQPSVVTTETLAATEYLIITPTTENIFPRSPIPTLSINDEMKMVEILKSTECNLPCYMGIVPGKTKLSDAKLLLDSLGATFSGEGMKDNTKWFSYAMRFDDPLIDITNNSTEDQRILYDLGLIAIDDVVQQISIWILARGLSPKFQDYWSRYSPKGVFLQLGMPDAVYSASGHLALVYEQLGIINTYATFWKDGQLCPQNETGYFDRRFVIKNKDSSDALYTEFQDSLRNKALWNPIQEDLGVSVQEFYNKIVSDDSICFDIKIK